MIVPGELLPDPPDAGWLVPEFDDKRAEAAVRVSEQHRDGVVVRVRDGEVRAAIFVEIAQGH